MRSVIAPLSAGPSARRITRLGALLIACLSGAAGIAHAHDAAAAGREGWRMEPWIAVLLVTSALAYLRGFVALRRRAPDARGLRTGDAAAFATGWLLTVAALAPPLDPLAAQLFSAHMVQHSLLMVVAAPLLALGRPFVAWSWAAPRLAQHIHSVFAQPSAAAAWRWATAPFGAWLLHAAAIWLWHAPPLFEAALASDAIHELQHGCFFVTALLFWWSILGSRSSARTAGVALAALFTTMLHTAVLGALIALSTRLWYSSYAVSTLTLGRNPLADQQLGGLLMWVPASAVYLAAALFITQRLLARDAPLQAR